MTNGPGPSPSLAPAIVPPLVYALASVFVPFLGWLAGIALIATSRRWTRRAKLLSTLSPIAAAAIVTAASAVKNSFSDGGQFVGPSLSPGPLRVVPTDLFAGYFVLIAASFIVGMVLLAIALRRSDRVV
jgi:hypothetical protein